MSTTTKTDHYILSQINKYKELYPKHIHQLLEKFLGYAAIPVALNSEFLHLLRINFFLDPPNTLPYTVESDFLLSSLCQEIGDSLYEIKLDIRNYLLKELTSNQCNKNEINEVATLLWQYTLRSKAWFDRLELDRAQKLTALNLLDKSKAQKWLDEKENDLSSQSSSNKRWFVAMRRELKKYDNPNPNPVIENEIAITVLQEENLLFGIKSQYKVKISKKNISFPIKNFAWSPKGSLLAIVSINGYVAILNSITKTILWENTLEEEFTAICWSPDNQLIALGTDTGIIYLLKTQSGTIQKKLLGHSDKIYSIHWLIENKQINKVASCSADKILRQWDIDTGQTKYINQWPISNLEITSWVPNWFMLASSSKDKDVDISFLNDNKWDDRHTHSFYERVSCINWSVDGQYLLVGLLNGDVVTTRWSRQQNNKLFIFRGHNKQVNSITLSADNKFLASKSLDNTIRLWSVDNQEQLLEIESQTIAQSLLTGLAFHPELHILAVLTENDSVLNIWELNTIELLVNQKTTLLSKHNSLYINTVKELKNSVILQEISDKISLLKDLEQKLSNLLEPIELEQWKRENNRFIHLLQKGYEIWNSWKILNSKETIDLSQQDLSKYNFNLNFINFNGVNLKGANLSGVDLTKAEINDADLSGAILHKTKLNSANLVNTKLLKAQLQGNDILYGNFSDTDFTETDLTGIVLKNIMLDRANFTKADLTKAQLVNCSLQGSDFTGSYWNNTNLSNIDLNTAKNLKLINHINISTLIFTKPIPFKSLPSIFLNNFCVINYSTFEFETVKVNAKGKITKRSKKQAKQIIDDLGNGVILEMVEIPSGTYLMGSPNNEGSADEKPQHKVTIPAFYIGKYQITQAQWKAIMGNNPSRFTEDDNLPVERVSWNDAVEFCKKLSERTKKTYRLPSEAEWEYACRAGTTTAFAFGETITPEIVNYNGEYPYGKAPKGEYRGKTIPVGSLGVANDFGLYDMHGNVWEWCQDHWHSNYNDAPTYGSAWEVIPSNNTSRVLRGGSYLYDANNCRCANRYDDVLDIRYGSLGFRVVMIAQTLR